MEKKMLATLSIDKPMLKTRTRKRRSRYYRTAFEERQSINSTQKDLETIFRVFGPEHQFNYVTAEIIATITGRYHDRLVKRLRQLWDCKQEYLNRHIQPNNQLGGSKKAIYYLDRGGVAVLNEYFAEELVKPLRPLDVDPHSYKPEMDHMIATNRFHALGIAACRQQAGVELKYHHMDHKFPIHFEVTQPKFQATIDADWFFGLARAEKPTRNFFVELVRPSRKTGYSQYDRAAEAALKNGQDKLPVSRVRSLTTKFRDYFYFYQLRGYKNFPNKKHPEIETLEAMRVLVLCDDMSEKQFRNVISIANHVVRGSKTKRLFWFAKTSDFDLKNSQSFFARVWITVIEGEKMSVLT